MLKKDLFTIWEALNSLGSIGKAHAKFRYAVSINKQRIEKEVEILNEIRKPSEDYISYDKKRIELCEKYCERTEDGDVVRVIIDPNGNQGYKFNDENQKLFDEELEKLREEMKSTIDEQVKREEEFGALLDEESDLELHKVTLDYVPEDFPQKAMDVLAGVFVVDKLA